MISVVVPLYNKEQYIIHTLKSVQEQNYKNFEVIIVNDGSTDNSIETIKPFFEDVRFKLVEQPNAGVSAARNTGVANSKYEHIAFLDADDLWMPDYLAKMHEAIDLFPDCVMYNSAGVVRNADGSEIVRAIDKFKGKICRNDFFENPHVTLHTSATVVTRTAFNEVGGFPVGMVRNEDYALFFSIAFLGSAAYIGFPYSLYNGMCEGQATRTPMKKVLPHIVERYDIIHKQYVKSGSKNSNYLIFIQYELRHTFKLLRKRGDQNSINYIANNLNKDVLRLFYSFETSASKSLLVNKLLVVFIYITKLRWRLRGFPRYKW